jgi:hypothetical protein
VDEGSAAAKSVAVALYTTGLLTFSIFLGVVANEIGTRVAAVQAGNFRVVDRGHTVLLVCSSNTVIVVVTVGVTALVVIATV